LQRLEELVLFRVAWPVCLTRGWSVRQGSSAVHQIRCIRHCNGILAGYWFRV